MRRHGFTADRDEPPYRVCPNAGNLTRVVEGVAEFAESQRRSGKVESVSASGRDWLGGPWRERRTPRLSPHALLARLGERRALRTGRSCALSPVASAAGCGSRLSKAVLIRRPSVSSRRGEVQRALGYDGVADLGYVVGDVVRVARDPALGETRPRDPARARGVGFSEVAWHLRLRHLAGPYAELRCLLRGLWVEPLPQVRGVPKPQPMDRGPSGDKAGAYILGVLVAPGPRVFVGIARVIGPGYGAAPAWPGAPCLS